MLPVFVLLSSHRVSLVGYVSFVWQPFTSDKLQWMRALLHCYTWAGLMHIIFMMSGRLPSDHTLCWQGNATLLHNTTFFNDSVWVRWLGCMYQLESPQTLQYVPCGLQENNGLTQALRYGFCPNSLFIVVCRWESMALGIVLWYCTMFWVYLIHRYTQTTCTHSKQRHWHTHCALMWLLICIASHFQQHCVQATSNNIVWIITNEWNVVNELPVSAKICTERWNNMCISYWLLVFMGCVQNPRIVDVVTPF